MNKQAFQVTDRQKSLFKFMADSTIQEAEAAAVEACEFYKTEARIYHNGFVVATYLYSGGKAVKEQEGCS
jgi:regulator of replication initiation timing